MGLLGTAWQIYETTADVRAALAAARDVLASGGSPIRAAHAFVATTGTTLDDAAVVELEAGIRRVLIGLELVSRGCLTLAESLSDQRVRTALDQAITGAIEAGWRAGSWRAKLRGWIDES